MRLEQPEDKRPSANLKPKDYYETPNWFFAFHDAKYQFDLDACAVPATAKCQRFYTLERGEDSIILPWSGRVWCNPPYSQILRWVKKGLWELQENPDCKVIMFLIPMDPSTQYFKLLYGAGAEIITWSGRLSFLLNGTVRPSPKVATACFVVYPPNERTGRRRWHHMDINAIEAAGAHIDNLYLDFKG